VGCFSLGRVLSSPALGEWSVTHGYRAVLIGSCLTIALGSLMYCITSNIYMLMASQLLMGIGSGTLGVTRAYVADRTPDHQRTYMLAYLTAMQYAGFTVSPLLGSILCKALGEDDPSNL
jgi:MFS transporter, ceroid-lipofuscinosis neuronal protein 7